MLLMLLLAGLLARSFGGRIFVLALLEYARRHVVREIWLGR